MNETIEKLIASGKEGPWWDFKRKRRLSTVWSRIQDPVT